MVLSSKKQSQTKPICSYCVMVLDSASSAEWQEEELIIFELRIENMEFCLISYTPLWLSVFVANSLFEKTKPMCKIPRPAVW